MIEFLTVWPVMILDPIAALVLIVATQINSTLQAAPVWHRLGLLVIACGLLGQAAWNVVFVLTGHFPGDLEMPFWVLKDYGIQIMAGHYLYTILQGWRHGG